MKRGTHEEPNSSGHGSPPKYRSTLEYHVKYVCVRSAFLIILYSSTNFAIVKSESTVRALDALSEEYV